MLSPENIDNSSRSCYTFVEVLTGGGGVTASEQCKKLIERSDMLHTVCNAVLEEYVRIEHRSKKHHSHDQIKGRQPRMPHRTLMLTKTLVIAFLLLTPLAIPGLSQTDALRNRNRFRIHYSRTAFFVVVEIYLSHCSPLFSCQPLLPILP